ncbi:MAG: hypothetical protein R2847_02770 [Bacteroidia bacterium]
MLNGIFIANATGDTPQDGGGLNPNLYTDGYKQYGLAMSYANIILPILLMIQINNMFLFHQTGSDQFLPQLKYITV